MHQNKGFSLVQLAVIVAAAGFVAAAALPSREGDDVNAKYLLTKQRMQKIDDATVKMMATWGRRPCPASGMYKPGDAEFGVENGTAGTCTGGAGANGIMSVASNVVAGMVPVRKLHLSEEYAFDGWGRPFTYVVDTRATARGTCVATDFVKGGINVVDGGTEISAMQLLISHGPDGYGSYLPQGSANANRFNDNSSDADQIKNAGGADFSTPNANSYVKKDKTSTFDDFLFYSDRYKNNCCLGKICKEPSGGTAEADDYSLVGGTTPNAGLGKIMISGNVGGDTREDLVIGNDPTNTATANKIYVLYGTNATLPVPISMSRFDASQPDALGFTITTELPYNDIVVGDINMDGVSDIAIAGDGWAAVLYGTATNRTSNVSITHTEIDGEVINAMSEGTKGFYIEQTDNTYGVFGKSLAIGDIDRDGALDLVIGQYDLTEPLDETKARGRINVIMGTCSSSCMNGLDAPRNGYYTNAAIIDGNRGFGFNGWGYTTGMGATYPSLAMGKHVSVVSCGWGSCAMVVATSENRASPASPEAKAQIFSFYGYVDMQQNLRSDLISAGWGANTALSDLAADANQQSGWIQAASSATSFGKAPGLTTNYISIEAYIPVAANKVIRYKGTSRNTPNTPNDPDTVGAAYGAFTADADSVIEDVQTIMQDNVSTRLRVSNTLTGESKVYVVHNNYVDGIPSDTYPAYDYATNPDSDVFYANSNATFGKKTAYIRGFTNAAGGAVLAIADPNYNSNGSTASGAIYLMFGWGDSNDFSSGTPPGDVGSSGTTIEPY